MDLFLATAAIISFIIFLVVSYHFAKEIIASTFKKRDLPLVLIAVAHMVYAVILWLWANNTFSFILEDYIIIFSSVALLQTLALTLVIYNSTKNIKVFYTFALYLILIPLVYVRPANIHMIIPISFLTILLSFTLFSNLHKRINQTPIAYSAVSLLGYIASILWQQLIPLVNALSAALFLVFIHLFMKGLRTRPEMQSPDRLTSKSPIMEFTKHFLFILILTNFVFIGTTGAHELGHIASAKLFDCQDAKIVLNFDAMPHTETTCSNNISKEKLLLAGIILPFIIALFLIFSGGKFIREIALQIIAFNIIISYQDILLLGLSVPIATAIRVLGIVLVMLSLGLLAKSKTF